MLSVPTRETLHVSKWCLSSPGDPNLCALIQALPTKADIEALFIRLEELHRNDLQAIHPEVHQKVERASTGENAISALDTRISQMEAAQFSQTIHVSTPQLHLRGPRRPEPP